MLRITATSGERSRKVSTNSHASQTIVSLFPLLPWLSMSGSFPPMTAVGSLPAMMSTCVSIEVTVVLPCVPQTPMQFENLLVTAPNSFERSKVGIELSSAAQSSGLSSSSAAV